MRFLERSAGEAKTVLDVMVKSPLQLGFPLTSDDDEPPAGGDDPPDDDEEAPPGDEETSPDGEFESSPGRLQPDIG
jgi:hypothetical protein